MFPVIVVNGEEPGERQRFTLAHELAHLLLSLRRDEGHEALCHRFAGAFLVPADALFDALGRARRVLSMGELFSLKSLFGVSAQAIARRAKDLGIVSDAVYEALCRQFSARGWRRREPNPLPAERPERFQRLCFHAVSEGIVSESRGAELLGVPIREFIGKLENPGDRARATGHDDVRL
jgi:Zn-dependent peptidase ImmA (M78 family)